MKNSRNSGRGNERSSNIGIRNNSGADKMNMPDITEMFRQKRDTTGERLEAMRMLGMIEEYENMQERCVAPDTFGVDYLFVKEFINPPMEDEFWLWTEDFLKHCYSDIPELYEFRGYYADDFYSEAPDRYLKIQMLGFILNAAKMGNDYARNLLKYLYKIYYKQEYNQLKRFRRIKATEILGLTSSDSVEGRWDMARILTMCSLMDIEMDEKCGILYMMIEEERKRGYFDEEVDFFEFKDGVFEKARETVDEWMESVYKLPFEKKHAKYWEVQRFIGICFRDEGLPEDYAYKCECAGEKLENRYTRTLALLRSLHPKREYTFDQVQQYAALYEVIAALIDVGISSSETFLSLLGLRKQLFLGEYKDINWFKPENVMPAVNQRQNNQKKNGVNKGSQPQQVQKTASKKELVRSNIAPVDSKNITETDYLSEIEELREKLRKQEQETKHFQELYQSTRKELKETIASAEKYQGDREELIALRDFVYQESQEQEPIQEKELTEMQEELAEHKIILIGGHVNWLNKMRQVFPEWSFINLEHSTTVNSRIVENCEKVYFFTDHLSHGAYGRFMSVIREKGVAFGYLNSINLENLTRLIYEDLIKEK